MDLFILIVSAAFSLSKSILGSESLTDGGNFRKVPASRFNVTVAPHPHFSFTKIKNRLITNDQQSNQLNVVICLRGTRPCSFRPHETVLVFPRTAAAPLLVVFAACSKITLAIPVSKTLTSSNTRAR